MIDIENIDICEPIRLGYAKILYRNNDDIIIHELRSHAIMMNVQNIQIIDRLIDQYQLWKYPLFDVKQKECVDILVNKYHKTFQFACYQAVYTFQTKINYSLPPNVTIHQLSYKHKHLIYQNYKLMEHDYIDDKINKGHLWGLFEDHHLAGFIGIHDEGSMGMLEILPTYRHKGYGTLLESFLINYFLEQGWIPYCQVLPHNKASLNLQKKLGLAISNQLSYWLF